MSKSTAVDFNVDDGLVRDAIQANVPVSFSEDSILCLGAAGMSLPDGKALLAKCESLPDPSRKWAWNCVAVSQFGDAAVMRVELICDLEARSGFLFVESVRVRKGGWEE